MTARITSADLEADRAMRMCLPPDHPLHIPRVAVLETVRNGTESPIRHDQARDGKACGLGDDRAATGTPEAKTGKPDADMSEKDAISSDMPEKTLQRLIESDLRRHMVSFLHMRQAKGNRVGWPDLIFAIHGTPVALELKTLTGRTTPEQDQTLADMAINGWQTHVVRSWEQYRAIMDGLTGGKWAQVPAESEE